MTRALLIEPQALFAPYFANMLAATGSHVTVAARAAERMVRTLDPNLVVVDATGRDRAPLETISDLRRFLPAARIVLFSRTCEPLWASVASAVGADVVIGPSASETEFIAALS